MKNKPYSWYWCHISQRLTMNDYVDVYIMSLLSLCSSEIHLHVNSIFTLRFVMAAKMRLSLKGPTKFIKNQMKLFPQNSFHICNMSRDFWFHCRGFPFILNLINFGISFSIWSPTWNAFEFNSNFDSVKWSWKLSINEYHTNNMVMKIYKTITKD